VESLLKKVFECEIDNWDIVFDRIDKDNCVMLEK